MTKKQREKITKIILKLCETAYESGMFGGGLIAHPGEIDKAIEDIEKELK